jgi:hypothetical protein
MSRAAVLFVFTVALGAGISGAQDSTSHSACSPVPSPAEYLVLIARGAPYDSVRQYVWPEASLVKGRKRWLLADVLKGEERGRILNEDSTRIGSMDINYNDARDALSIIFKTTDRWGADPHYHSVMLFKMPSSGWQICSWHVGE